MAEQQAGGDAAEITRKLLEYGEDYLGVSREFWKLIEAAAGPRPAAETAEEKLRKETAAMQATFAEGFARLFGQSPTGGGALTAWQQLGGGAGPQAWPGFPAFGPARERQLGHERLTAATVRYQRAVTGFGEMLSKVSAAAVEQLAGRITAPPPDASPLTSLRAVHDLWVECGERAWATAAHGAEFSAAQAELNAALVELRAEQQRQLEDWARAFDLPTRAELNTMNERLTQLRRQVRELEQEIARLRAGRAG